MSTPMLYLTAQNNLTVDGTKLNRTADHARIEPITQHQHWDDPHKESIKGKIFAILYFDIGEEQFNN